MKYCSARVSWTDRNQWCSDGAMSDRNPRSPNISSSKTPFELRFYRRALPPVLLPKKRIFWIINISFRNRFLINWNLIRNRKRSFKENVYHVDVRTQTKININKSNINKNDPHNTFLLVQNSTFLIRNNNINYFYCQFKRHATALLTPSITKRFEQIHILYPIVLFETVYYKYWM